MRLEFYFVLRSVTRKYDLNNDGWNVCYGSEADMHSVLAYVCFGPIADISQCNHAARFTSKSGHARGSGLTQQ
jgi:hypothetical protein